MNATALEVVKRMVRANPAHILQNDDLLATEPDEDDLAFNLMLESPSFNREIALRMSSKLKNSSAGFTFGRNQGRCDIWIGDERDKNISNIHFSIYINSAGILMIKDCSTNGTNVDDTWLRKDNRTTMLQPNSTISLFTQKNKVRIDAEPLKFMVRFPARGEYVEQYKERLREYIIKMPGMENVIVPAVSTYDTNYGMHWNGGQEYNVVGHLGKGAFATVYKLATKKDGRLYAAKELDKRRFMKNGVLDYKVDNEMKIMATLRHPNIVQYESYHSINNFIYIVMEFVPGGELSSYVQTNGPLYEPVAQDMTRQLLHALRYLHHLGITHRDIKPDNILLASYQPLIVKLSDFGLSKCVTDQETFLKTFCGTLLYCAPEVYPDYSNFRTNPTTKRRRGDRPPKTSPYSQAVDMWSFGAVLYHVMCNKPPVVGKGDDRGIHMLNNIMNKEIDYNPLRLKGISDIAIDFVSGLLNRDPEMRPNELMCFNHDWVVNVPDHYEYESLDDDLPANYQGLAAIDELDEDVWNDSQAPNYLEEPLPYDVIDENEQRQQSFLDDRADPRFLSKRQRLRGGGSDHEEENDGAVDYPSLPQLDPIAPGGPMNEHRGKPLFGEIPRSVVQSSGLFGEVEDDDDDYEGDVPPLSQDLQKLRVADSRGEGDETTQAIDQETTQYTRASTKPDPQCLPPEVVARQNTSVSGQSEGQYPDPSALQSAAGILSAAPSLFGAEADLRDLNMTSAEDQSSNGISADAGDDGSATSPETRPPSSTDEESTCKVNDYKMAPPPLPAGIHRKSSSQLGALERITAAQREKMSEAEGLHGINITQRGPEPDTLQKTMMTQHAPTPELDFSEFLLTTQQPPVSALATTERMAETQNLPVAVISKGTDSENDSVGDFLKVNGGHAPALAAQELLQPAEPTSNHVDANSPKPILDTLQAIGPNPGAPVLSQIAASKIPAQLGRMITVPGSIIDTTIAITRLWTIYGRSVDCTDFFPDPYDARVPKYGLKLTFLSRSRNNLNEYLSQPDTTFSSISDLYVAITTSKSRGVDINGIRLPNRDSKPGGWYFGQIQTGDIVTLYKGVNEETKEREYLKFQIEINYGDSANMRKNTEPFRVQWALDRKAGASKDKK